eukprot:CAMPEP_0184738788 /NCGR_PEP_ID=MMETSP0315-20130426/1490_1 /TAXON_ID=101924 /ORGANISM="Rhodosorus marinus, Strain UTEX LB 2760" /LENGTH=86 /DNA_ID=CAMNT_0027206833 /DNA_START=225 /DNA_END=485 /DNA_ORIENTATION=-
MILRMVRNFRFHLAVIAENVRLEVISPSEDTTDLQLLVNCLVEFSHVTQRLSTQGTSEVVLRVVIETHIVHRVTTPHEYDFLCGTV